MIGVVSGQMLSIGWEGTDLEHFIVKKLGSIETTEGLQYPHPVRSSVRIILSSNGGPHGDANTARAAVAPNQRTPQKSADNSDVESEIDDRVTNVVANRKLTFPLPHPVGYRDVAQWDNLLLTHITMGNPNNTRQEKQFWEKAYKW